MSASSYAEGEFVSVVGPSGCGKTTLLLALVRAAATDDGEVRFAGARGARRDAGRNGDRVPGLQSIVAAVENQPWQCAVRHAPKQGTFDVIEKIEHAMELLAAVGLAGFERHYPWQLSGGMQQRVAIARGLASQSRLLLLDEPLASVDAQTRADMQDFLLGIARRYGQTCVLVTHDVEEAIYMGDRIVVLSRRPTRVVREIAVNSPGHAIRSRPVKNRASSKFVTRCCPTSAANAAARGSASS